MSPRTKAVQAIHIELSLFETLILPVIERSFFRHNAQMFTRNRLTY